MAPDPEAGSSPPDDMKQGTSVAHYRIEDKIGEGGMGEVFVAEDTRLKRKVALKFLPRLLLSDKSAKVRFVREARAAAGLDHPNIITVHEVDEYQGRPYFAMHYVDPPRSLKDVIDGGELTGRQIIEMAIQICDGLRHAHQRNIVHRDIKPTNIMIDSENRPKIVDFGLASVQDEEGLTQTGTTVGTIGYMSPEQVQAAATDGRSDVFSLGVILYQMATGLLPFKCDSVGATLNAILSRQPEVPAALGKDLPQGLSDVIMRALEKDPETRYQSAADMLADLKRVRRAAGWGDSSQTITVTSLGARPPRRRFRSLPIIGAGMAMVAALLVLFVFTGGRDEGGLGRSRVGHGTKANSIAVLPFKDFSPGQDQEYFCDGMTDAIIGKLSSLPGLKVISLTSMMRYKNDRRALKEIGDELKVSRILEGSILKEGDSMRVRAQLIDVQDDSHLWSETYDRQLESIFAVQDDISRAVAEIMKVHLAGEAESFLAKRYTDDVEAYNLYMKGRALWRRRTADELREAIKHFEQAIARDSAFALAYSGLADAWSVIPGYSNVTYEEAIPKARAAAQRALELDSSLPEGHASMGLVLACEVENEEAEKEYLRAIELNPGYAWAHTWYANILGDMHRAREQLRVLEKAHEIDPWNIVVLMNLSSHRSSNRQFGEAERLLRQAMEAEPDNGTLMHRYGSLMRRAGRPRDAVITYRNLIQLKPDQWEGYNPYVSLAFSYSQMGFPDSGLMWLDSLVARDSTDHSAYRERGDYLMYSGRFEKAEQDYRTALQFDAPFDVWEDLGGAMMMGRKYQQMSSMFALFESSADPQVTAGISMAEAMIAICQGKFGRALTSLAEVPQADSGSSQNFLHMRVGKHLLAASVLLELGRHKHALEEIARTEALRASLGVDTTCPDASGIAMFEVYVLGTVGRTEEIIRMRDKAGECRSMDSTLLAVFQQRCDASVAAVEGDFVESVKLVEESISLVRSWNATSESFNQLYALAGLQMKTGQYDKAVTTLEGATSHYSEDRLGSLIWSIKAHYLLGRAYEETGDHEKAIAQYEEFLTWWGEGDAEIEAIGDATERLKRLKSQG